MITRTFFIIAMFSIITALTSCSNNANLTDDDAMRIIQQHVDFSTVPIKIEVNLGSNIKIKKDSLLGQEMSRLIQEGFLTPELGPPDEYYQPTSKGKDIVGRCWWNHLYGEWDLLTFYGLQRKPVKITSKLIDSKSGVAVVQYEIYYTATDYVNKIYAMDTNDIGQAIKATASQFSSKGQITLKLWDDGWHPMQGC